MKAPTKKKIGELLLESGLITSEQLEKGLERQKVAKSKLGKILVDLGFIDETVLLNKLAEQLHIPFIEVKHFDIKADIVKLLPEAIARRNKALVLSKIGSGYLVGMVDPTNLMAFDEISRRLKGTIRPALVRESDLVRIMDQHYRRSGELVSFANELAGELEPVAIEEMPTDEGASGAPVSKMIETIFEEAVQLGASDIHIEPDREVLRIRLRVDGVLQEQLMNETKIAAPLILRIKLMSKLNISEKRIPQDGRFTITIKEKRWDVRVSTMPVQYGESVVMRLLDQSGNILSLDALEMEPEALKMIRHNITRPHGMVLVTGPTGSGKSTTLYACITELNLPENKIITVEDPVEYQLPRINQVQVQPKIDLTFARILRSCLRQDPDVIMVGEIRDEETAEIGLRAALTGHMVLSTLHTNDAISAPIRLIDMGIEPFLVASAIRMVVAQRLIRKICENCVNEYKPTAQEAAVVNGFIKKDLTGYTFKKGNGCSHCNKTGYRGRLAVHEILEFDQELTDVLRTGDTQKFTVTARKKENFKSLGQIIFDYATKGKTTLEELIRVSGDLESESSTISPPLAEKPVDTLPQNNSPEGSV